MAQTQEETFPVPINGRKIMFQPPTDAQLLLVNRLLRKAEELGQGVELEDLKSKEGQEKARGAMDKVSKILDIIDSMVVNPADRDWLEQQIIDRKLDLTELVQALTPKDTKPPNRATKRAAVKKTARARAS